MTIKRIWRGWTSFENADIYRALLKDTIFPLIASKNISGYKSIELFRRDLETEVEFTTIMTFETLKNVIEFQGQDYQRAHVPEAAQKVLKRWDKVCTHHEALEMRRYT